ncbi:hypothetical protein PGT21_029992 [Puccinia graminis f. sp. tritici]|uniref:sn-1-specific diacylglycerol lipase n=2 Tax=Puccinia graminis f. sp. tritici TaxID=56615 RepID=A0A5B0R3N1_PUCGR|nr:hypothetical protein PGT21_029992 [Puccinia graminis f. sp. tritici]
MLNYLTNLASYYLLPQQQQQQQHQQQQQQLLSPHPTYNSNALSLASIASKTDQLTQSNQSFLPSSTSFPFSSASSSSPLPLTEQQQQQLIPNSTNTTILQLNLNTKLLLPTKPSPHKALSPRATHDLISRLDATSPLLPQNLANFITAASLAARVSLRSSAFFIELILESLRYSTTTSLGITRRALISAVGSARAIHYNHHSNNNQPLPNSSYLNVLDHYTNVGIYLVHHVFTMAELLSIAGLDLTHSVISTGFETAEVSVMMLDSIFGSNESSRALSAIIMLVRRELLHDPRFTPSHSSTLTGLVALTKAITAFACLQLATTRRTTASMKMRVVWDATMIAESVTESKSLADGIDYQLGIKQGRAHGCNSSHPPPSSPETHTHSPPSTRSSPRQSIHKLSESDKSSLLTDLRTSMEARATHFNSHRSINSEILSTAPTPPQSPEHRLEESQEIEYKLTQILTDGENNPDPYNDNHSNSAIIGLPASSNTARLVPDDVRKALYQVKRTSYSRTQSYSSELTSLGTTTLPDYLSTATYQLTTLTTQTTRTRTTTTNSAHSSTPNDHDHHFSSNTTKRNNDKKASTLPSSPQPSYDAYQVHWSANVHLDPHPSTSTPPPSRPKMRIMTRIVDSQPKQNACDQTEYEPAEQSPSDHLSSKPKVSRTKSMPSSPRRSFCFTQSKVVRRSLTRSKTHSNMNDLTLLDDPYSFVYPLPTMVSTSQTPPSSPSVVSEESSLESDELVIQPDQRPFTSTISEIPQEDEDENQRGYFGVRDGPMRPVVPPPPSFNTNRQKSSTSIQTVRTHQVSQTLSPSAQPPSSDFPPQPLVKNLGRFMRYSSAAYGQQFLRIMGIGVDSFNYPNTRKHSANDHAFASHVGLPVDQILLSSFTEPNPVLGNEVLSPLVHYVSIDHDSKAVVLTCRGTLGLSDILVDLTCEYEPIAVDGGDPSASYLAHSGMLHSALRLRRESSTVHEVIKQALIDYPSYGLIITGHSLGGGVAALLAVLCSTRTESFLGQISGQSTPIAHPPISTRFVTSFRSGFPPGRPIHSYTYGTPAVASLDLSEYTKGLVTTVCNGIDIVPTLSLGVLHDLKSIAVSLHEEESVAIEIVKKVVGLYRPKSTSSTTGPTQQQQQQQAQELFTSSQQDNDDDDDDGTGKNKEKVSMKEHEIRNGVGDNRANGADYRDPALEGSVFGKAELTPELGDWLWSLRRTMRAVSDAEKLYPPGEVWHVESYEVFVVREVNDQENKRKKKNNPGAPSPGARSTSSPHPSSSSSNSTGFSYPNHHDPAPTSTPTTATPTPSSATSSRRQGRRIILRACDDVQARFSEPIFGKTMFHDHIPSQYELVLELLETAIGNSSDD